MAKPLNGFGGWLKFFQISCLISAAMAFLGCLASVIAFLIFIVSFNLNLVLSSSCSSIIFLAFFKSYQSILRVIKERTDNTANTIVTALCRIIFVNLVMGVTGYLLLKMQKASGSEFGHVLSAWRDVVTNSTKEMRLFVRHVLINSIWIIYFFRSKRVSAYYGANATKLSL